MKAPRKPQSAKSLTVAQRVLLFCIASETDWKKAGVTGAVVMGMLVRGLIDRDALGKLTLSEQGHAALAVLLKDRS
jgi:hypothetical protein